MTDWQKKNNQFMWFSSSLPCANSYFLLHANLYANRGMCLDEKKYS